MKHSPTPGQINIKADLAQFLLLKTKCLFFNKNYKIFMSLAPDQDCVCDFWDPAIGNYKL